MHIALHSNALVPRATFVPRANPFRMPAWPWPFEAGKYPFEKQSIAGKSQTHSDLHNFFPGKEHLISPSPVLNIVHMQELL
jgi:hypothetical protein